MLLDGEPVSRAERRGKRIPVLQNNLYNGVMRKTAQWITFPDKNQKLLLSLKIHDKLSIAV
ncbi:hypothetical protein K340107D12_48200 [Blautia parvula]|uniref:Uncharacterized protein n=1 Tax=Blautia parvula TaxID=2877527 RepID=A0ABQ0BZP5_9FIRM